MTDDFPAEVPMFSNVFTFFGKIKPTNERRFISYT
jgi:hypothetical protein